MPLSSESAWDLFVQEVHSAVWHCISAIHSAIRHGYNSRHFVKQSKMGMAERSLSTFCRLKQPPAQPPAQQTKQVIRSMTVTAKHAKGSEFIKQHQTVSNPSLALVQFSRSVAGLRDWCYLRDLRSLHRLDGHDPVLQTRPGTQKHKKFDSPTAVSVLCGNYQLYSRFR